MAAARPSDGWRDWTRRAFGRAFGRDISARRIQVRQLLDLYPFHLVFDAELNLLRSGPLAQRLVPPSGLGMKLEDFAAILRPMPPYDYPRLLATGRSGVMLQPRDGPRLTGGVIELSSGLAAFLGTPVIDDLAQLDDAGLRLGDLSPFDQTAEISALVRAKNLALQESQGVMTRLRARDKQVRAALALVKQDQMHYRTLVDCMPIALLHIDGAQRCKWANERWTALTGLTQAQSLGDGWLAGLHHDDWAGVAAWLPRMENSTSRSFGCEARLLGHDRNEIWVYAHCRYDEAAGDGSAFIALIDITERRQLQRNLLEADRLAMINSMTAHLAQSFNSVMFGILGDTERVTRQPALLPEVADSIRSSIECAREITRSMMAVARQQPLQAIDVEIDPWVEELRAQLQHAAEPDSRVEHQLGSAAATAFVDPAALREALLSLIGFMARQPWHAPRLVVANALVRIATGSGLPLAPGRYAMLAVNAPGVELADRRLDEAFVPFAWKAPGGSPQDGLRLAALQGFARQSGGAATIEFEQEVGLTINLYLPEGRSRTTPRPAPTAAPRGAGRILIVDDEAAVLALVKTWLEELGYSIVTATSGEVAMQLLGNDRFDLLLTDLLMPGGMHGLELLDAARALHPGLRVIVSTGFAERGLALRPPDCRVLVKPYTMEQLGVTVRSMLPQATRLDSGRNS